MHLEMARGATESAVNTTVTLVYLYIPNSHCNYQTISRAISRIISRPISRAKVGHCDAISSY